MSERPLSYLSASRARKEKAPLRYLCKACQRMSPFQSPCSQACRERATPEQLKPTLQNNGPRWGAMP